MRLVSLELFGFKSFAQRTKLRFSDGITAIVGPNGCGKSNIVDAFRWVLGEPSARALRGEKMQDVIFSGSLKKKPQQFAEVTVTLTDVQGILPVAYDEVALSRRVYRSGESEFRLNGQQVRMKDIQALLWDSGLGRQAFSVFEQGRIDQILQSSPAERRALFEEIAGISRFKERRKETLRKLDENHAHLERLEDIHKEVSSQVQILEKQAAIARKFREQKDRADWLEKSIFASRYQHFLHRQNQLRQQLDAMLSHGGELDERREQQQAFYLEAQQAAQHAQSSWDEDRLTQHQNEQKLEGLKASLRALQRQREETAQRVLRYQNDEGNRCGRLAELQNELDQLMQLRAQQQEQTQSAQGLFMAQQQATDEAQLQWDQVQRSLEQLREQERRALVESQRAAESGARGQAEVERCREKIEQIVVRLAQLAEELESAQNQERDRHDQLNQARSLVAQLREALTLAESKWRERQQQTEDLQQQQRALEQQIAALQSQSELLTILASDRGALGAGGKALMEEALREESPLFGRLVPLTDTLTIPAGTEQLLATALGRAASALVAQDRASLEMALEFAQAQQLTDLVLMLPARGQLSPTLDAILGDQPAIGALLQGLDLCESTKLLTTQVPSVTLSGWMRDARGLLICGAGHSGDSVLHQAQLQSVNEALEAARSKLAELEDRLRLAQHAVVEAEQAKLQQDRELRKGDLRLMELSMAHAQLQALIGQHQQQTAVLHQEQQRLHQALQELMAKTADQSAESERWRQAVLAHQQAAEQAKQAVAAAQDKLLQQRALLKESEQQFRRQQAESHQLANRIQVLEGQQREADQQKSLLMARTEEEGRRLEQLEEEGAQLLRDLDTLQHHVTQACQASQERAQAVQILRGRAAEAEQSLLDAASQIRNLQTARSQIEQQLDGVRENLEMLESNYAQRFFEPLSELTIEGSSNASVTQAEKEVKALRQELEQAKDVNLGAIDELERIGERHRFLAQQLHDVAETERQLQAELQSLEVASRKIFKDAFETIRHHFQKNFAILFEGGSADLRLADTGDILESGIEIIAQPPGKQMRILQLLSGGERSLTAMALLFAMFETKPAPFCLLDEMDAALDDANVDRFTRLLGNYMDKTQFLLITHNKRTMASADLLLGVSMQEKGVSTVLALDFAEAEQPNLEVLEPVGV
jgi:chromosome segregation protein